MEGDLSPNLDTYISTFPLEDDGKIPNSPLPLLLYQDVFLGLDSQKLPCPAIENILTQNQWGRSWRNGIYRYHHYHSNTHEVLIVYSGKATVLFGGDNGVSQEISVGDAVIIPAGVGHKNVGSSLDFGVIGAYPDGHSPDMRYGKDSERKESIKNIESIPIPKIDPLFGLEGPLQHHWPHP